MEVVVPATRQRETERLVHSLALGTVRPSLVTIVSNEVAPFDPFGLDVRLLRFSSSSYCYGSKDVTLRQNVGIFAARDEQIVISGDDQLASATMIEDCVAALRTEAYAWGNHRILGFGDRAVAEIVGLSMTAGVSRETPAPPARHGWPSCYGGMFTARTAWLREIGGFDMAFNCRHAGEDQQLGRRIMKTAGEATVLILGRPFGWLNNEPRTPYGDLATNSCGDHDLVDVVIGGLAARQCRRCPYLATDDPAMYEPVLHWRYDNSLVETREEQL